MAIITICSSANFYRKAVEVQAQLEAQGYTVIVPLTAEKMRQSGDFDPSHYRTWLADAADYHKKTALMRTHFAEIDKADMLLVINEEKHGVANYIGGNVLIEMALAFHRGIPIFLLHDVPQESSFLEEIIGLGPIPLKGRIAGIGTAYDHNSGGGNKG